MMAGIYNEWVIRVAAVDLLEHIRNRGRDPVLARDRPIDDTRVFMVSTSMSARMHGDHRPTRIASSLPTNDYALGGRDRRAASHLGRRK